MTEQECRKCIKSDLFELSAQCASLIEEIDAIDLNDIDWQILRAAGQLERAKNRLKNCEDY